MANRFLEPAPQAASLHGTACGNKESDVRCLTPYSLHTLDSAETAGGWCGGPGLPSSVGQQEALGLVAWGVVARACWLRTLCRALRRVRSLEPGATRGRLLMLLSGMADTRAPDLTVLVDGCLTWQQALPATAGFGPVSAHTASVLRIGPASPSAVCWGRSTWWWLWAGLWSARKGYRMRRAGWGAGGRCAVLPRPAVSPCRESLPLLSLYWPLHCKTNMSTVQFLYLK